MTSRIRNYLHGLAVSLFICLISACQTAPNQAAAPLMADTIITGGNIITVDADQPSAEAVAIRGAYIVNVGTFDDMALLTGPDTQIINLNGKTLIPGFIEGHGHFLSLGRAQQILDLNDAESFASIVAQVAAKVAIAEPGEWIFGRGWHQDKWQEAEAELVDGVPVNTTLNAISPNNPVFLGHASGHAAYANDAALAAAGIDATTADPAGGTIVRSADGRATGLLREKAQNLVEAAVTEYERKMDDSQKQARFEDQVQLAGQRALENGITSFHDAGATFAEIDGFKTLESRDELPIRLYVMVRGESNQQMQRLLPEYFMAMEGNDFLTVRSIKRQIDGALGAHGAWLLNPYEDLPNSTGLVLEPVEEIETTARIAIETGYQVNTHAIGTRANREVLDLYERVWNANETDGRALRWRIEHAQHIHPDDLPRFANLGVIAAIQGVHCTSDGPWIPSRLGNPRTEVTSYRWRDLIDAGVRMNNGTDVPVERINPIASYYASVARIMGNGRAFFPAQAMTRMEALKSYTLDNAWSAFEEAHKGSITPGKLADLVVLNQDILSVPANQLPKTRIDMTMVGGVVKFTRKDIR